LHPAQVAAATIAHGSMMKLEQFEQLTQPTQLLCAEEDPQWPPEFLNDVTKVWLCRLQRLESVPSKLVI